VVGSRGSVIPVFQRQRANGKITITDERMTRFWITLEQGVQFVIKCVDVMQGGEVFVPKIPSMRIIDLAEVIAPDCEREIIGVRAGEKLHEVLVSRDESRYTLEFDDMYLIQPVHPWWIPKGYPGGRSMGDGAKFSSDTNVWWLAHDELRRMVEEQ
jgi:UDP-N-acetylglucosamine 4,6-dehydratase